MLFSVKLNKGLVLSLVKKTLVIFLPNRYNNNMTKLSI